MGRCRDGWIIRYKLVADIHMHNIKMIWSLHRGFRDKCLIRCKLAADICIALKIWWWVDAGAPFEAILKSGPRMLWWSEEPIASAPIAALYKLDAGQDKMFTNAMVQRLAEAFRTGTNATRVCILKVFLLVSKGSKHSKDPAGSGLLRKERIANYPEVLRRVKAVMDSGDATARALALRMIGCLGEIAADSVDIHRHVIEALESPHQKEVNSTRAFQLFNLYSLSSAFSKKKSDPTWICVTDCC